MVRKGLLVIALTGAAGGSVGIAFGAPANVSHNTSASVPPRGTLVCSTRFRGDIREGPDRGQSVAGELVYTIAPSGAIGGALVKGHSATPITGSLRGRSFSIVIPARGGAITGVGTARSDVRTCNDIPKQGTLTGARPGDRGDWGLTIQVDNCRGIPYVIVICDIKIIITQKN